VGGREEAVGRTSILLRARECSPRPRENDVLPWFTDSSLRSEGVRSEGVLSYSKFPVFSESIL
jgi:hypothetical protein